MWARCHILLETIISSELLAEYFLNAPNFWKSQISVDRKRGNVYVFTGVIRARETIPLPFFLLPLQTELFHLNEIL
jgi:hypothetical protein